MIETRQLFYRSLIGLCFISTQAYCDEAIQFKGSIPVQTEITSLGNLRSNASNTEATPATETVYLQKLTLSKAMRALIARRIEQQNQHKNTVHADNATANTIELGMNGVPVLNQGQHGTCATFATTAGLDAYLGKQPRNYISEMCNLELGSYLEILNQYYPSGWDGSFSTIILKQMSDYGIIPTNSCPDSYPIRNRKEGNPISISAFNSKHEMVMQSVPYTTLVEPVLDGPLQHPVDGEDALARVKTALQNGHRVLIGNLIADETDGDGAGVNGKYNNKRAAWVLSPATASKLPYTEFAHEMVITGFNDDTVITEVRHKGPKGGPNQDGKHTGVLTLRNSWGPKVGIKGDYYMSYDFFKAAVIELNEIGG